MDGKLPESIVWRKEKIGFEPPQQQWMQHKKLAEMIQEAKMKLVRENILKKDVLNKRVRALGSHEPGNYDWRYLSAAAYL